MSTKYIPTPSYKIEAETDIYEPAEDTFLLLDALQADAKVSKSERERALNNQHIL